MRSNLPTRHDAPETEALLHAPQSNTDLPGGAGFDRLARKLRRAGLVWAQAEPSHLRWSLSGDFLTTLVAESPWIRRRVDEISQGWNHGATVSHVEAIPGCWVLPSGARDRCDGAARGLAVAVTRQAAGPRGSLRALCQGAGLDHDLVRDMLLRDSAISLNEIPRLAAMVRLLKPVALQPSTVPGVETLLRAVETTHRTVRGHSERTSRLAQRLAEAAGLSKKERETARLAGLLHDVGKLGVPESVIRKPGALTAEERSVVNLHPEIGHRMLQGVRGLEHALPGVLWHHERWDGAGYPHRLSGESIPQVARIMSIADSFDAMRSERPYRRALSDQEAIREIREGSGRQFDPRLAKTFLQLLECQPALAA
ncbi:MAG: HD-GYP domain-containing protein [Planctomycetes bacterium]|nr:HD-GYP domain-containing protein [Planctomycetota bacterium]